MTTSPDSLPREPHEWTAQPSMPTPLDDILRRGNTLRRRRRRATIAGIAVVGVAAALGTTVIAPSGSSPLVPQAQAAWGRSMVSVSSDVLDQAAQQCGAPVQDMESDFRLSMPLAADSRNGATIVVYRDDEHYAICSFRGEDVSTLRITAVTIDSWTRLPAGTRPRFLSGTFAQETPSDPLTNGAGALRVTDDVARLTIDFAGETWETSVDQGFAMFWMPDGISHDAWDDAIVTTYDSDDHELSSHRMIDLA